MSLDIKDALAMLKENSGECYLPIHVPSLNKDVNFMPLTVGRMKTIAKLLLNGDEDNDIFIILLSMVLDLDVNKELDLTGLNEIDFIRILLGLRNHNNLNELVYKLTCTSPDCDHSVNYEIDLNSVIKRFEKFPKNVKESFKHGDMNIDIEFGMPSLNSITKYKKFIELTKKSIIDMEESFDEVNLHKIEFYLIKYSVILYIKNIIINGKEVDNWEKTSIKERNDFIDSLPSVILEYIKTNITDKGIYDIPLVVESKYQCPKCEKIFDINLDATDFFLM